MSRSARSNTTPVKNRTSLERELRKLIPHPAGVITDPDRLSELGRDKWFAAALPEIAVAPGEAAEVAAILGYANERGIPVTTRGAGHGYVGGCVPVRGGILMSTHRMNRIKEIHDRDSVAVVEPGVITGVLQEAPERRGSFILPIPPASRSAPSAATSPRMPAARAA